tara:strand:+ start:447 stop:581 length:135 start_codon:yes stop_codon:yes gene_type:complete
MTPDTNTPAPQDDRSNESGCWKWIFIGLIVAAVIGVGFLVLTGG